MRPRLLSLAALAALAWAQTSSRTAPYTLWSDYGGAADSMQYSALKQITTRNVNQLELVWSYKVPDHRGSFGFNPVIAGNVMYVLGQNNAIVALDASTGEPLSVGRARRTVPPAMRRALALRDKGCRFPGCDRPVEWTDAHHVQHWADDGPTELANLVLLCRRCHRRVHEGRWRLECMEAGELVAAPP